ncbi:hypothetical protein HBI04_058350 [Parastagonospora nodorum]|nr:hypothetical protein HBI03_050700 [Parastagonospora nodorum]KAH4280273.1 hypothetical protein HBI04_058350 [Parastagonospora nodorum]KAH5228426.1 hypothetical protein HBI62_086440 [Parastagonospora nodorum]KAH6156915.1 hypothetical protein HBI63_081670 [Parastagonospora nodorum]KAH6181375.1 hypothetical protein HBI61_094780 [Parastagonospora nodorum]
MGIPDLRETIEACEDIVPIAQLAEEHFLHNKRPLKIAVDESDWRFNNVSPEKVAAIRRKVPAANPVEKAMFYRICNLLTLNIELVFVFDGPDVPAKRGRTEHGRKVSPKDRELLKETLTHFGIPYIDAPGEAEAECCNLQKLRIVDAVWSQDSDCLMFGCTLWLRDHRTPKEEGYDNRNKGHTKKAAKTVRVVRAATLAEKHRLKREGCVLFAMLAGGDYDPVGLARCGAMTSLEAAKSGLGISLCKATNQDDCHRWREHVLKPFFKRKNIQIAVPANFPSFTTLLKYNKPRVHPESFHARNKQLFPDYKRSVDEAALLRVTVQRFNIWARLYMEWVVPTLLIRDLADRDPSLAHDHVHGVELLRSRPAKNQDITARQLETKIGFSPMGLTKLLRPIPGGTEWKFLMVAEDNLYQSTHRVECEVPTYLLRKVLPPALFALPISANESRTSKRIHDGSVDAHAEQLSSAAKRSRMAQSQTELVTSDSPSMSRSLARQSTAPQPARGTFQLGNIEDNGPLFIRNYPARSTKRPGDMISHGDISSLEELDLQRALRLSLEMRSTAGARSAKPSKSPKRSGTPEIIDLT